MLSVHHEPHRPLFHRWLPACLILLTVACSPSPPPPDVLAETNLGTIHRTDLDDYILSLPEARRSPPADQSLTQWRRQVLEKLIVSRALEAEARDKDLAETPAGRGLLETRADAVLAQAIGPRMIAEKVDVTEEDLRNFYDTHPEEFSHPEQIRLRNIYRRVASDASPEVWEKARQEMEAMLHEISRGARFEDFARTRSDSETAPLEGLIGRLDRGQLDPALEAVLWSMDEGEVSQVIRSQVGFQIFKVENFLGNFKMDYEEARTRLYRRLTREATEAAEQALLLELLEASGATYEPENLGHGGPEARLFALGNDSITVGDLFSRLDSIGFSGARESSLRQHLDRAVLDRLYLWKARETGISDEPAMAEQLEKIERETLVELALRERKRASIDEIDEQDLHEFYVAHADRFQSPRLLHLRILTRDFPPEGRWYDLYEELDRLAQEIRAGRKDFAQAARELSTDYTAAGGGDVGAIRLEAIADWAGPRAQHLVKELAIGEVSEPILIERYNSNRLTYTRAGYMLVRLEKVMLAEILPFEEVRDKVVEQFVEQGSGEILQRIHDDILSSIDTEIYEVNL